MEIASSPSNPQSSGEPPSGRMSMTPSLMPPPPEPSFVARQSERTLAFFEHINLIYGTISEFCTMSGCPDMNGPGNRQYLWFDEKGKKCKVAAPQYIDYVMTFTQKTINDELIFPTKFANDFPSSFECIVKKILRLLFHVIAHMYQAHFKEIVLLNLHSHLNCTFAHVVLFNEQFQMIDEKEMDILQDLIQALKLNVPHEELEASSGDCSTCGESEKLSERRIEGDDSEKEMSVSQMSVDEPISSSDVSAGLVTCGDVTK